MELVLQMLSVARKWRYHRIFPFAVLGLAILSTLYVPLPDGVNAAILTRVLFALPIALILFVLSIYFQRPPQNKSRHIGVVFAIKTENESLRRRVSSDIITEAKRILEGLQSNQPFHVFEPGSELADSVTDIESAEALRRRCKAHMVIFGEAKQRKERGQLFHLLHLTGLVAHSPLPDEPRSTLAKEMTAVMPLRQRIEEENEISGFEITSVHLAHSVKFVIATAALLSHDGLLAVRLLEDLSSQKGQMNKNGNLEAVRQLQRLIPKRLCDAYKFMSIVTFARWEADRNPQHLRDAIEWIEKSENGTKGKKGKITKADYSINYMLLKGIEDFVIHKSVANAKKWIEKCENRYLLLPEWKYSAAFLQAYEGNLDNSLEYYESALLLERGHEAPFQIEGFIAWVLETDSKHTELNFCLGYINQKLKGDKASARSYYERFLSSTPSRILNATKAIRHATDFIENQNLPA